MIFRRRTVHEKKWKHNQPILITSEQILISPLFSPGWQNCSSALRFTVVFTTRVTVLFFYYYYLGKYFQPVWQKIEMNIRQKKKKEKATHILQSFANFFYTSCRSFPENWSYSSIGVSQKYKALPKVRRKQIRFFEYFVDLWIPSSHHPRCRLRASVCYENEFVLRLCSFVLSRFYWIAKNAFASEHWDSVAVGFCQPYLAFTKSRRVSFGQVDGLARCWPIRSICRTSPLNQSTVAK